MISRRALLTAGASAGVTGAALLLGACGREESGAHRVAAGSGELVSGTMSSRARGQDVGWSVAYPPGRGKGDDVPVCLTLHGRYEDHRFAFSTLHLDQLLAEGVAKGVPEFAIASVDGGSATNWHGRASGDDPQAMLVEEFLPMLAHYGMRTDPVGLWGWSLGGYGALLLATVLPARRVGPVVATSPALWPTAAETAPDVFDDAEDFARNNVYERVDALAEVALRIDIGDDDSFAPNVEQFIASLSVAPAGGVTDGSHDAAYWTRVAPAEIAFIGRHLAADH